MGRSTHHFAGRTPKIAQRGGVESVKCRNKHLLTSVMLIQNSFCSTQDTGPVARTETRGIGNKSVITATRTKKNTIKSYRNTHHYRQAYYPIVSVAVTDDAT